MQTTLIIFISLFPMLRIAVYNAAVSQPCKQTFVQIVQKRGESTTFLTHTKTHIRQITTTIPISAL